MSVVDRFRKGEISRKELQAMAEKDSSIAAQASEILNEEMSEDELHGIAAAGSQYGGAGDNSLHGGAGDDFMDGGAGEDTLYGGAGEDTLSGGAGEDTLSGGAGDDFMDGGYGDGADDVASGGAGDDTFVWGLGGDGNDTFHGGPGSDTLELDLFTVDADTIKGAYEAGDWSIELTDGAGNSIEITDAMWDTDGNLHLPEGVNGVITGTNGETMTFDGVETISTY